MEVKPCLKLIILLMACCCAPTVFSLCDVETGEVIIIIDLKESIQNKYDQLTEPALLPINGNESEIELNILVDSERIFSLDGKRLRLTRPLDRDLRDISFIQVQLRCIVLSTGDQRTIPVTVRVIDINDNAPRFLNLPYETSVSELVPVGTTVFRGLRAEDDDSSVNSLVEYFLIPGNNSKIDGFPMFSIDLPHQGFVTLRRALDYEKAQEYEVTVVAVDRATKSSQKLTSTITLTVNILDADDLDPTFEYENCTLVSSACVSPQYFADVVSGKLSGFLDISPAPIKAFDRDSLNSTINYSFSGGFPVNYDKFFVIDAANAMIKQVREVNRSTVKQFSIIIKAEEESDKRRFATAKLDILVRASDGSQPSLVANVLEGYVDEHSSIGTLVLTNKSGSKPVTFMVSDLDLDESDPKPKYDYQLTTDLFAVNGNDQLMVNKSNLDRDLPRISEFIFQVLAREIGTNSSSVPLTVTVYLNDVNDNSPTIEPMMPVAVASLVEPSVLARVKATDIDSGINGDIIFSLYHVSNNGTNLFAINETTGDIMSVVPLQPGAHYSLTVQAADRGGRTSHSILQVDVAPLARVASVVSSTFKSEVYYVQISEGAAIGTTVLSLQSDSTDVSYSIKDGDSRGSFQIGVQTGILSVQKLLDREEIARYALTIGAKDRDGHVFTTTVKVNVTDINDNNPLFVGTPYVFTTDEGLVNSVVGSVRAIDSDAGPNGIVYYSVPSDSVFKVDPVTGEVRTRRALDYETHPVQYLIVTAFDGAADPRISTATVTIRVNDAPDEVPIFEHQYYEANVVENVPNVNILQVTAYDPDTFKHITYVLKEGPQNRFAVDSKSGVVRNTYPLDYEESAIYMLTVGIRENFFERQNSNCIVKINVIDRNDVPPLFTSIPPPLRIQDTVPIGTPLATVVAVDSDGTPPNNLLKYTLGRNNQNYFDIDQDTGTIILKSDLSKDLSVDLKIEVKAYDLGSPQLTSTATITIYVDHVAPVSPEMGLAFSDTSYTVEIEENSVGNTVVKSIPIINRHLGAGTSNLSLFVSCEIERGNEFDHFYALMENGACEVKTKGQKLDYETRPQYLLAVMLKSSKENIDPSRSLTELTVMVKDVNDNRPIFIFRSPATKLIGERYVTALSRDAAALTTFAKVLAIDHDSGSYGQVVYAVVPGSDSGGYFVIDHDTGLLSNSRTFDNLSQNNSFFELTVKAYDNPRSTLNSLNSTATLAVNLISDEHRLVLVILDAPPERVAEQRGRLTEILQDNSNLVVHIEKIESRKYLNNSRVSVDSESTDVWFNVIDPNTLRIVRVSDNKLDRFFLSKLQQRSLLYSASIVLKMNVESVRFPLVVEQYRPTIPSARMRSADEVNVIQAALIALASIIAVLSLVGVIYVCFVWSRYTTYRDRLQRLSLAPRYEPVLVEPNLKPYETQVLQMTVQLDDSSSLEEIGVPFDYKGMLDDVSYITKETGDGSTLALGGASFTESDSFEGGDSVLISAPQRIIGTMRPANNPVYHSSDENGGSPVEGSLAGAQTISHKTHTDLSPVATTTEL